MMMMWKKSVLHTFGEGHRNISAAPKVPMSSSLVNGGSLEPVGVFLELADHLNRAVSEKREETGNPTQQFTKIFWIKTFQSIKTGATLLAAVCWVSFIQPFVEGSKWRIVYGKTLI